MAAKKLGNNKAFCEVYRKSSRRELNKMIKQARHSKKHPNDNGPAAPINYTRKKPLNYFEKTLDKSHKVC